MTKWEQFFDKKIKEIAQAKNVLDVGGCRRFQKQLSPYEKYFEKCNYKTVDVNPACYPDILASAQALPFNNNSIEGIVCKAVLEHVENPFLSAQEIYRVLQPGGKALFYLPFIHAYHGSEKEKDYWRFTADGVKNLFKQFSKIEICPVRGHLETLANLLPYKKPFFNILINIARFFDKVSQRWQSQKQTAGHCVFLVK